MASRDGRAALASDRAPKIRLGRMVEDGDSRKPDLMIAGSLPDIVHFATVPTLGGRLHGVPDPRRPHGRRALRRIANRRVRVEGDRTLARRLLRLLAV